MQMSLQPTLYIILHSSLNLNQGKQSNQLPFLHQWHPKSPLQTSLLNVKTQIPHLKRNSQTFNLTHQNPKYPAKTSKPKVPASTLKTLSAPLKCQNPNCPP